VNDDALLQVGQDQFDEDDLTFLAEVLHVVAAKVLKFASAALLTVALICVNFR